jgi:hypothetical protein
VLLESREEETNNILLSRDSEESVKERSTFLGVFVENWVLLGIIVFYFLFYKEKLLWKKQQSFVCFFFVENWVLFESGESEFLQREASSGSRSSFFFGFFLRKFGKLGALLKPTRSEIFYLQGKKQQLLI